MTLNVQTPLPFIFLYCLFVMSSYGQTPICDSLPAYYCQTTPLCQLDDLNGRCFAMFDQGSTPAPWPGCANSLDNQHWVTFLARDAQTIIQLSILNCSNNSGIQLGVFEMNVDVRYGLPGDSCLSDGLAASIFGCQYVSQPIPPGPLTTLDFASIPGRIYGILTDGWGPDLCEIRVNVIQGSDGFSLDTIIPSVISWDDTEFPFVQDTVCVGAADVAFSTEEIAGASDYTWTIDGQQLSTPSFSNVEWISFPTLGSYELCVVATNYCDTSLQQCLVVTVADCPSVVSTQSDEDNWAILENPVVDYVNLKGQSNDNVEMFMFDLNGNSYAVSQYAYLTSEGFRIHVVGLIPGVYFLRIQNNLSNQVVIKRFIKL